MSDYEPGSEEEAAVRAILTGDSMSNDALQEKIAAWVHDTAEFTAIRGAASKMRSAAAARAILALLAAERPPVEERERKLEEALGWVHRIAKAERLYHILEVTTPALKSAEPSHD